MKLKLSIKGFTLVELILVVGIIAILFTVAFMVLNPLGQFQKANDTKRKSDLAQIQRALESYYQDNERYPRTTGAPSYCLQHIVSPWPYYCGNSNWSPYMNLVPKDPKSSNRYVYYVSSDGQSYYIYANLERGMKDPQACNSDGTACDRLTTLGISATACGGTCNYGVSSPNVSP
ncbi:MAG: type II secretion system protein GspG [Patescibacteria group bacterium]